MSVHRAIANLETKIEETKAELRELDVSNLGNAHTEVRLRARIETFTATVEELHEIADHTPLAVVPTKEELSMSRVGVPAVHLDSALWSAS